MPLCRQAERFSKCLWDERVGMGAAWQIAFLNGEQKHALEVQATCLEHSHHLKASIGFAMKRNFGARHHLSQQTTKGEKIRDKGIGIDN